VALVVNEQQSEIGFQNQVGRVCVVLFIGGYLSRLALLPGIEWAVVGLVLNADTIVG
jgi:hypothetical protein